MMAKMKAEVELKQEKTDASLNECRSTTPQRVKASQERMEANQENIDANNEKSDVHRGTLLSHMDIHQSRTWSTQAKIKAKITILVHQEKMEAAFTLVLLRTNILSALTWLSRDKPPAGSNAYKHTVQLRFRAPSRPKT
jgi:translation elongation factor EF-1alpha